MTDVSEPRWATGRRFVPSHLNPGNNSSSFSVPQDVSFRAAGGVSPPSKTSFGRSRQSRTKPTVELDMPPTESLRTLRHSDADKDGVNSASNDASRPPSTPRKQSSRGSDGFSVLVFGYPPGHSAAVVQNFARFGDIVENTTHSGSTPGTRPPAISCGRNWLRLTYRERSAAERALGENGRMMPGQFVIGAAPAEGLVVGNTSLASLLGEEDISLDEVREITERQNEKATETEQPAVISGVPTLNVRAPTKELFHQNAPSKDIAPLVRADPDPKGWLEWTKKRSRELLFGSDDI